MESITDKMTVPAKHGLRNNFRSDCYVILAAMLIQPPTEDLLDILLGMECGEAVPERINNAFRKLRRAVQNYSLPAMKNEFDKLFVGLGCGEIVPYASWYREKKIQSLTLALLRRDLRHLGIVRQADNHEPEDHAGALCEAMALISQEAGNISPAEQANFFYRHVEPWMISFFQDLQAAKSASFYRTVGLFGSSFLAAEKEYIQMKLVFQ